MNLFFELLIVSVPALLAFLGARYQANSKLRAAEKKYDSEIISLQEENKRLEKEQKHELEKMSAEVKNQRELMQIELDKQSENDTRDLAMETIKSGDLSSLGDMVKQVQDLEKLMDQLPKK